MESEECEVVLEGERVELGVGHHDGNLSVLNEKYYELFLSLVYKSNNYKKNNTNIEKYYVLFLL